MWYYSQGGQRNGPVPESQIKEMVAAGRLARTDHVWREGMGNWTAIENLPEFASALSQVPPAIPSGPAIPPAPPKPLGPYRLPLWVLLVVAGGLLLISFFTPYFYASASPNASGRADAVELAFVTQSSYAWLWGWDFWWGILAMVFGVIGLTMAILSLTMRRSGVMQAICKWVCLGVFGGAAIVTILGMLLGLFGFGVGTYMPNAQVNAVNPRAFNDRGAWITFSEVREAEGRIRQDIARQRAGGNQQIVAAASLWAVPITACLAVLAAAFGCVISLVLALKRS